MLKRISRLEEEIAEMRARYIHHETDKAWRVCRTRKALIFAATYAISVLLLFAAGSPNPFFGAFLPVAAFAASTLVLDAAREWWLEHLY